MIIEWNAWQCWDLDWVSQPTTEVQCAFKLFNEKWGHSGIRTHIRFLIKAYMYISWSHLFPHRIDRFTITNISQLWMTMFFSGDLVTSFPLYLINKWTTIPEIECTYTCITPCYVRQALSELSVSQEQPLLKKDAYNYIGKPVF